MPFPHDDPYWVQVADLVVERTAEDQRVIAPDIFWAVLPKVYRYDHARADPTAEYDWIVVHKGMVADLPLDLLDRAVTDGRPVLANDVFVVFGPRDEPSTLDADDPHLQALVHEIEQLRANPVAPTGARHEPVLPEEHVFEHFARLSVAELRAAMNQFYDKGGYEYATLRDQAYLSELDALVKELLGDAIHGEILDLCCGTGSLAEYGLLDASVTGVDLSDSAVRRANDTYSAGTPAGQRPNQRFAVMDAHALAMPDAVVDVVLFVDSMEHVHDARATLAEAARVLRPGGRLLTTAANRNSVNQVITRRLGYPEFVTNYQHIAEFGLDDLTGMLDDAGFDVVRTEGIFLFPYWGIPGVDQAVRHLTDDDPEVVELMRKLGRLVGAEHAYTSVVAAVRRGDGAS